MSHHARPHLQTHTRSEGHSAVAGAAYRLGLKLYDQRAGKWHDFRRRALGEEIVRAVTIAPESAPTWATDPGELWNRAEAAEKRKDSQVARDYRVPIPFGLTDGQAGDLAEEMARFISNELHTSVSMGLHRDAGVDVLGNLKPVEKQGFHAHLYFPTRKIEQLDDGNGSSVWGLGAKLVELSNKRTSGAVIEAFNAHWAMLANRMAAKNSLEADYDHRSYARQGLETVPQPKVGHAATAMERRGVATRKGDALRAGIVQSEDALKVAASIVLDVRRQEKEEKTTSTPQKSEAVPCVRPMVPLIETPTPIVLSRKPAPPSTDGQPLIDRFRASFARSTQGEGQEPSLRVVQIVGAIERALLALLFLAARLARRGRKRERHVIERQGVLDQLGRARASRSAARDMVREWEAHHSLRASGVRLFRLGSSAKPPAWQKLLDQAESCDRRVQSLKESARSHQDDLVNIDVQDSEIKMEQAKTLHALETSMEALASECQVSAQALMSAATAEENVLLSAALPGATLLPGMLAQAPEHTLAMPRQRSSPRM